MIINSIQRYQLDVRLNCKAQSIAKEICKNVDRENTPAFTKRVYPLYGCWVISLMRSDAEYE